MARERLWPTSNAGPKYGMNLTGPRQEQLGMCVTPWHGVGVELSDGSRVIARDDVARALEGSVLVQRGAAAWGYRVEGAPPEATLAGIRAAHAAAKK